MKNVHSTNKQTTIHVLLADDHHIVRSGICRELNRFSDIEVVGEATDGLQALELAQKIQPDILLLDINMPKLKGPDVVKRLNELPIPTPQKGIWPPYVLIFSAFCDRQYVFSTFAAGAKGYLLKDESPERLAEGIRDIMQGKPALSTTVQQVLISKKRHALHNLTERELEVMRYLAQGHTNAEIARVLAIAPYTVRNHIANIYKKLPGICTRAEAVAWAWENNLVSKNF